MGVRPRRSLAAATRAVRDLSKAMKIPKRAKRSDRRRSEGVGSQRSKRSRKPAPARGARTLRTAAEPSRKRAGEGSDEADPGSASGSRPAGAEKPPRRGRRKGGPSSIAARAGAAIGAVAALLFGLLRGVWALLNRLLIALAGPTARITRRIGDVLRAASRALTPTRGILLAALGCTILLGLAQFADYRGVAIGLDDYAGVDTVAPAPEVDRAQLGSAHGYVMIPVAVVVIALLLLAVRRNRWQLCRITALVGMAVIAVSLLIDRPTGLDEGALVDSFAGVEAQLLGGWWVQLFAGVGLTLTSLLLAREIRNAPATAAGPISRRRRTGSRPAKRRRFGARARADAGARGAGA